MEKIKNFIKKYNAEILIALSAITSIIASVATMEGSDAVVCSIAIAFIAVLVEVLKNGFNETAITLLANAIKLVIDALKEDKKPKKANADNEVVKVSALSVEDIKERLKENL